ncbi:ATP-dependent helicase [Haloplasma contractile]|uniref:DNA 3'-5' helicase n=1 Tax=Haloplasma contractile SSD-17B TaxID=1033810 RepID=U2EEJ4_9MOLU|nr:UvrD-helicase domain-containing protein [Haloplasma contractile]ERJ13393.1 ATP-dependent DNA helicase PcrA protein [Haloplasma contractile SSD-17B]
MTEILQTLNKQQVEAVKHYRGPMLVMAGAGSGKTKVLTNRIAYLISEKEISPYSILAITFTNKAAKEMKHRVIKQVGPNAKDMWISTFHSMCLQILRQDIDILGYNNNFIILDDKDSTSVIKKVMKELNIDSKRNSYKKISAVISAAKNDYIFPEQYKKKASDEFETMVASIYERYQRYLQKSSAVDFDDLIMLTIKLFERDEEILKYYQQKFQFVLVDEYQDTNKSQFRLVRLLAKKHHNIFVVGDTDQSIYSWRGADIRNIQQFETDFKNDNLEPKVVYLEQNYRSFQNILSAANDVIKHNTKHTSHTKQLWSDKGDGDKIVYYRANTSDEEADFIAKEIATLVKIHKCKLSDFAVLYRTNSLSLALEKTFNRFNIDYHIYGNVGFFSRREIKDLTAYLRLIVNPDDDVSYARVVNMPKRGIGKTTLEKLESYANDHNLSLYLAAKEVSTLSVTMRNRLGEFNDLIEYMRSVIEDMELDDLIDLVLVKSGYRQMLEEEGTDEARDRLDNLKEFKTLTVDLEEKTDFASIKGLTDEDKFSKMNKLNIMLSQYTLETDHKKAKPNSVKMMTIHAAKGLEFPYVFVYGLEENLFPLGRVNTDPLELEEERRLMYVAITRAEKKLYLSSSFFRKQYGQMKSNEESRFIDEITENLLELKGTVMRKRFKKREKTVSTPIKGVDRKDKGTVSLNGFKPGTKVTHTRFGNGVIISVKGDIAKIAFGPGQGIKELDVNHPALTKR